MISLNYSQLIKLKLLGNDYIDQSLFTILFCRFYCKTVLSLIGRFTYMLVTCVLNLVVEPKTYVFSIKLTQLSRARQLIG